APPGPYPSYVSSSYVTPSSSPVPRLMARSMLSFGMLLAFASAMAARRRGLPLTSPPPMRAATVISLRMRVKTLPRFASAAPFLCLMVDHLLWPDIGECSFGWGPVIITVGARGSAPAIPEGAGRAAARPYYVT